MSDLQIEISELDKYRQQGALSVYIAMTHWCNLKCPHCYDEFIPKSHMGLNRTRRIIEQVESLNIPNAFYDLSGGELMGIPVWDQMLEQFLATGRDVQVNTNGTLIDETAAKRLQVLTETYPDKLFLSVSLDSHDPELNIQSRPGSKSNAVFEGMRLLKDHDVRFRAAITLTGLNVETIEDTVRFIVDNYTREFIVGVIRPVYKQTPDNASTVVPLDVVQQTIAGILALKSEIGPFEMYHCLDANGQVFCEAGRDRVNINPNGDVTSCYALQTPDHIVGNIFREPLGEIMTRMRFEHDSRDNKVLLCEHQDDHWGEPPHRLGQ